MREAAILVPHSDNDGYPLPFLHEDVARQLCNHFGGVTVTNGEGFWVNPHGTLVREPVKVFAVACENSPATAGILLELADHIGYVARQDAVYIRHANGVVEIRDTKHLWAVPAEAVAAA